MTLLLEHPATSKERQLWVTIALRGMSNCLELKWHAIDCGYWGYHASECPFTDNQPEHYEEWMWNFRLAQNGRKGQHDRCHKKTTQSPNQKSIVQPSAKSMTTPQAQMHFPEQPNVQVKPLENAWYRQGDMA